MKSKSPPLGARHDELEGATAMDQTPDPNGATQQGSNGSAPENGQGTALNAPARRKEPRHKGINTGLHHSFFGGRIVLGKPCGIQRICRWLPATTVDSLIFMCPRISKVSMSKVRSSAVGPDWASILGSAAMILIPTGDMPHDRARRHVCSPCAL